jgi:ferredoxin
MVISHRIVLHFPRRLVDQSIVCSLALDYGLRFNILKAQVTPEEEGLMVIELWGDEDSYQKGVDYLTQIGVKVQPLSQDVRRDEEKCTHCGVCVALCPSGALVVDPQTRRIDFYHEKCIVCELCVKACPPRAMEICF